MRSALVVGTGLIGTSVALALRAAGVEVLLSDPNPAAATLAAALGGGELAEGGHERVDLAIIAAPPSAVAPALAQLRTAGAARAYTDVASTKSAIARAVAAGGGAPDYVGGHPLAGRERTGPGAARADLFLARPWVLTPTADTDPAALATARTLVAICGAIVVEMDADAHDRAVAVVSHMPQVLASLVAARLNSAGDEAVALAGQGVRDVTRIAASDPGLWTEILTTNSAAVVDVLEDLATDLDKVIRALRAPPDAAGGVTLALQAGNLGRARLPGKHGEPASRYAFVPVIVTDRPGELARLLTDVGEAAINIEDMRIEHSPGQPAGLVELAVRPDQGELLIAELRTRGWAVH
ncbi:MAG: prephenate dehydrogenase [Sporichthyaceae bacterium]